MKSTLENILTNIKKDISYLPDQNISYNQIYTNFYNTLIKKTGIYILQNVDKEQISSIGVDFLLCIDEENPIYITKIETLKDFETKVTTLFTKTIEYLSQEKLNLNINPILNSLKEFK